MEQQKSCIFCNTEKKYIIAENEYAFASYFPRAIKKGHFVVAVKEHIPTFTGLSENQARDVISLSLKVAQIAEPILVAEKFYIVAIGDKDFHFHFHYLPKLNSDPPMGKHIMSEEGWKGEVGQEISDNDVSEFIEYVHSKF